MHTYFYKLFKILKAAVWATKLKMFKIPNGIINHPENFDGTQERKGHLSDLKRALIRRRIVLF